MGTPQRANTPVRVSVVIPVYNCRDWIVPKLDEVITYFSENVDNWELIVVDDGSRDDTAAVAREYLEKVECASFMALPQNMGKGGAVLAGLRAARGVYRIFMDCDLAYPLSESRKIIHALENGADVAIANRRMPDSICELRPSLFKQVYSRYRYGKIFNQIVRCLRLTRSRDTQAGLKGLRGDVLKTLDAMTTSRFAFDIELLHLMELSKHQIAEVAVRYRFFDEESSMQTLKDGCRAIFELLQIKLNSICGKYKHGGR